jgi:hypothetical protein
MLFPLKKRKKKGLGESMTMINSAPGVAGFHQVPSLRWAEARRACALAAVAVLLFTISMPALVAKEGKRSRVVTGLVADEAENPIVGAAVLLTDLETGKKTATYTTGEGTYQFTDLQPTRDYEVQATHQGLSSQVRRVSSFDPRNRIVLNLRIPPPKEE